MIVSLCFADVAEIYFLKSIRAYETALGSEDYETLMAIEDFYKWLIHNGKKEVNTINL